MKKDGRITSFYIEVLLLTLVLIMIVLVLTRVFALGRAESSTAADLTRAVCLAQNAAEAITDCRSADELAAALDEGGNAGIRNGLVEVRYDADMRPCTDGARYIVRISAEERTDRLIEFSIAVYRGDAPGREPIYTLDSAVFTGEADA